jgi:hypothetical protein
MKVTLIDGEERARQYPVHFQIPPLSERTVLRRGDFVKVGLEWDEPDEEDGCRGERPWWVVQTVFDDGTKYVVVLEGPLNSLHSPTCRAFIKDCDLTLTIERRHILAIEIETSA